MIYRCRQCGDVLGIDSCYNSQFCNEICAGEYVRFIETGIRPMKSAVKELRKAFGLCSSPAEKIESRFDILDL